VLGGGSLIAGGGAFIKSVQRGTISLSASATGTAVITSVDVTNSVIRLLGYTNSNTSTDAKFLARVALTDSVTVTATLNSAPTPQTVIVSFEVTEYYPGAIKNIQRGVIALAGANPVTQAITAVVVAKTELSSLGYISDSVGTVASILPTSLVLTNTTTITASSLGVGANQSIGYQAVEWF
jgi:hypothetical protein